MIAESTHLGTTEADKAQVKRIWKAFWILLVLTIAELGLVIKEFEDTSKNGAANIITRDPHGKAEELLTRIDKLSDEDVDALLRQALAENNE